METPYIMFGDTNRECIVILLVDNDGPFFGSGLDSGDVLVAPRLLGEFATVLDQPTGSLISFAVVSGGHGVALEARPKKIVTVRAP